MGQKLNIKSIHLSLDRDRRRLRSLSRDFPRRSYRSTSSSRDLRRRGRSFECERRDRLLSLDLERFLSKPAKFEN